MKKTIFVSAVLAAFVSIMTPAMADACSSRARAMAAGMNASVIAVQSSAGANGQTVCIAKFQINTPGKPSRIVTKTFRP